MQRLHVAKGLNQCLEVNLPSDFNMFFLLSIGDEVRELEVATLGELLWATAAAIA